MSSFKFDDEQDLSPIGNQRQSLPNDEEMRQLINMKIPAYR